MALFEVLERRKNPEIYRLLDRLIQENHPALFESEAKIVLVFQEFNPDKFGRLVWGKCQKATKLLAALTDYAFAISLNAEVWGRITEKQREALLDHELCHANAEEDDDGGWKFSLRRHDLEEFQAIVERHGLWRGDVEDFIRGATKGPNPTLFDDPARKDEAKRVPSEDLPIDPVAKSEQDPANNSPVVNNAEWGSIPLASLSLPKGIVKKLGGAGLRSVGELTAFVGGNNDLTGIDGIGKKAAESVRAALINFHKERGVEFPSAAENDG